MLQHKKALGGLIALSLIMFMVTLDTTITNIALPAITNSFKSNLTDTNWISTIYVLVMSVVIIPASKLGDQFGRKRLMGIGLVIFGIGSILCGFSTNLWTLILMRFFQGIGGAIVTPIMIPLSVSLFGREQANKAVGIIGAVTAVAAAAGPPIGGVVLKLLSWQWIFFVNIPIVIITFLLLMVCFEESFDLSVSKRIDFIGIFFLTLALSQLTFLLVKGYDLGWNSSISHWLIIGTVLATVLFVIIERKIKEPLIELDLFKERTFSASMLIYFICGFVIVCSSLVFNFYLENVRGYSALNASYIIMFMSITVMISMPLGSKLADTYGYRYIITIGMVLMALSLVLLTTLAASTAKITMMIFMIILGFGFGFACLSIVSAVQFIPENKAGIASGVVNAARQLGTCLGIALLVGMMTHHIEKAREEIKGQVKEELVSKKLPPRINQLINSKIVNIPTTQTSDNNVNVHVSLKRAISKELVMVRVDQVPKKNNLRRIYKGLTSIDQQFSGKPGTLSMVANQITAGQQSIMLQNSAVLYQLVKDNADASTTLLSYKKAYAELIKQPNSNYKKSQLQQVSQMILVYESGINPNVTNVRSFNTQLSQLIDQRTSQNNVIKLERIQANLVKNLSSNGTLSKKVSQVRHGISLMDMEERINQLLLSVKQIKNKQLTKAFNDTFALAAWIVAGTALIGLLTDKKLD